MAVETPVQTEDPTQELDALIEEARRRARRRRLGYVAAIVTVLLGIGAVLLFVGGNGGSGGDGGSGPAEDPLAVVQDAATRTFSEETLAVELRVEAPGNRVWEAKGLVEPANGRFRMEFTDLPRGDSVAEAVVGLNGDTNTVSEFNDGFLSAHRQGKRCWLHGWAPAGFVSQSISLETAMHLTGAAMESLGGEVARANGADNAYEADFEASASQPQTRVVRKDGRVWGDRELLARLGGPIGVATNDGGLRQLSMSLVDYRPFKAFSDNRIYEGGGQFGERLAQVTVEATLAPAGRPLKIDRPNCQAIA